MRDTDYAYAVARIRCNETKLLTKQDIENLIMTGSCERCLARLADKGWSGSGMTESEVLAGEVEKIWALIGEISPEEHLFDSLIIPNDYHNLKAALKARLDRSEWEHLCIYPTTVSVETLKMAVDTKNFGLLPERMAQAADDAYDALVSWVDGQRCEMIIDAASLAAAIDAAKKQGGLLLETAEMNAFRADIRVAVRCARMKKPTEIIRPALADCRAVSAEPLAQAAAQGEDAICEYLAQSDSEGAEALRKGGLAQFEKLCAARLDKLLDAVKYESLGQGPVVAYICARMEEIRRVRIILAGLRNNVPAERIRELL